jgi:Cu(I)/Ag(I) efflux system membrane protein CusA/SilA
LQQLADVDTTWGPGAINSEDARLIAHVAFSPSGVAGDLETVESVMNSLDAARAEFPDENFELRGVGSFLNQREANARLLRIIPTVMLINLVLIYLGLRNLPISLVVFSGIPVAFAGGMITIAVVDVDMNTAVWVGFIALFGIAVDDGVVMATYIKQILARRRVTTVAELREAIYEAGLKRIRPCTMTTFTTLIALLPILMSTGRGADVARAMALPVFGGMLIEPFTTFIVPTVYCAYMELKLRAGLSDSLLESGQSEAAAADSVT